MYHTKKRLVSINAIRTSAGFVIAFLIVALFPLSGLYSQNYLIHHYLEQDGLASSKVSGMAQDHRGRMWFASSGGVSVYDGVEWRNFDEKDGLPGSSFQHVAIDDKSRVWVQTDPSGSGILTAYYEDNQWHSLEDAVFPPGPRLFQSNAFGLLNRENGKLPIVVVGTQQNGLYLLTDRRWQRLGEAEGLAGDRINGVAVLGRKIYAVTNKGISCVRYSAQNGFTLDNLRGLELKSAGIIGIGIEEAGKFADSRLSRSRIWLAAEDWLGYFEEGDLKMTYYQSMAGFNDKTSSIRLSPDYRSGIYAATKYEIFYFDYRTHQWQSIDNMNGLIGNGANAIVIDMEKNIWISCQRGVSKISSRRFSNFGVLHGLLENEVSSILEYQKGKIILGHNYGVTFVDTTRKISPEPLQTIRFFQQRSQQFPLCRVLEMAVDSRRNIWLACAHAGLARIDDKRRVTWFGREQGLPGNIICLWISLTDQIWVGTEKGIYTRRGDGFEPSSSPLLSTVSVRRIYGEAEKLKYLATNSNGIYIYNSQTDHWQNIRNPGDPQVNSIYAIHKNVLSSGAELLTVGTLSGLHYVDEAQGRLKPYAFAGETVTRPIYAILKERHGKMWLGSDNGIYCRDGSKIRHFTTVEGLAGLDVNRTAVIEDHSGKIWFGTNLGLSVYDDAFDNDKHFQPKPKVWLNRVETAKRRLPLSEPLSLDYKENTIVFHFRGISFLDETATRFQSKLEGFDQQWSAQHHPYKQMIRYTNLSPGSYRFHLKAGNAQGVWSSVVSSELIVIKRPYYNTWWFYVLMAMIGLMVLYSITRFFTQKRYALLLEKKVLERSTQLQAVEQRYRNLFEESRDTVFSTTPAGMFTDINPAGVQLLGYDSKEELCALQNPHKLYENPEHHKQLVARIKTDGYIEEYRLNFLSKAGEIIATCITATPVRDESGEIIAYRGIIRDITQQKLLELQLMQAQKMEAIGTLAGGIAHDFNNILGVIIGYTELAQEDLEDNPQVQQNIRQVIKAAEKASALVRQILTFSRQSERNRKPLNLAHVLRDTMQMLRSTLPTTIQINVDIQSEPAVIYADDTQIHQVIMNLCTNASHAMVKSGGLLEVGLSEVHVDSRNADRLDGITEGTYYKLSVSDTGHGIPQLVMKRIFEPYFTTKKLGEGTGMGLAVIHGIIKSHGGDITVSSVPGKGTDFSVFLPKTVGRVELESALPKDIHTGSERILLVDDEEDLNRVVTQMLRKLGYQAEGVFDPLAALKNFTENPKAFDMVITDLTMPHMTGIQLARELKNLNPGLPIILCSGFSTLITQEKIKAYGINDFIMKPIIKTDLAQVIRRNLDGL